MHYEYGTHTLQTGTALVGLALEDVNITGLLYPSIVRAKPDEPFTVTLRNVSSTGPDGTAAPLFDGEDENTHIVAL